MHSERQCHSLAATPKVRAGPLALGGGGTILAGGAFAAGKVTALGIVGGGVFGGCGFPCLGIRGLSSAFGITCREICCYPLRHVRILDHLRLSVSQS